MVSHPRPSTSQGSVLRPLLFLLYSADLPVIADKHGLGVHCYADDGQIYVFDKAGHADGMVAEVSACIEEIDSWMTTNRLKLNSDKTQFIWLGSRHQLLKVNVVNVQLSAYGVPLQSNVFVSLLAVNYGALNQIYCIVNIL